MPAEDPFHLLLGTARHQTYIDAAGGDRHLAAELYEWSTKLAGSWHSHLGYIEVAVRNAIDRELSPWNASQTSAGEVPGYKDWSLPNRAAPLLYSIIDRALTEAQKNAANESRRRPRTHPRRGATPNHDDIVAQLSFGAWSRMITAPGRGNPVANQHQAQLWSEALNQAFPGADSGEQGRIWVGRQLEGIRRLRNRIAHHDNLLEVDTHARLNGSLALLAQIHADFPALVMAANTLRQLATADPRLR